MQFSQKFKALGPGPKSVRSAQEMSLRGAQTEPFPVRITQEVELCQIVQEMGSNLVRIDYLQMGL